MCNTFATLFQFARFYLLLTVRLMIFTINAVIWHLPSGVKIFALLIFTIIVFLSKLGYQKIKSRNVYFKVE